jgi:hypothetical protein
MSHHNRAGVRTVVGTLMVILLAAISGCRPGNSSNLGRSNLGAKIGEREIKASLDGSGSISPKADSALVTFRGGQLLVEKKSLQLDGKEIATIPENAKNIEINYTSGKLTAKADGSRILEMELQVSQK